MCFITRWRTVAPSAGIAAVALSTLPHCGKAGGNPEPSAVSTNAATAPSSTDRSRDFASAYPWPPKYLLHTGGYDSLDTLTGLAVDDEFVFFFQNGFLYRKPLDTGPEAAPTQMLRCGPICQPGEIEADGHYVYTLAGTDIHRYDRVDASLTKIPLWASHGQVGELAMDDTYLYTALHGCAGIARYDKQTLQQVGDVLYADNAAYPRDAGSTTFAFSGSKIICTAPSNPIYVWDSWDAPARVLGLADAMRGIAVMEDDIYRAALLSGDLTPARLTRFSLSGATQAVFEYPPVGHYEVLGLSELGLVLIPFTGGFRRFSTGELTLREDFKTGRPIQMIRVGDLVYATMVSARWYPDEQATHSVNWIARIPVADFGQF